MGDRKSVELPSLWVLITHFFDAYKRIGKKGISGNNKGEGIIKGGVIIFDTKGKPLYAYKEKMGADLPVQDLIATLEAIRRESL